MVDIMSTVKKNKILFGAVMSSSKCRRVVFSSFRRERTYHVVHDKMMTSKKSSFHLVSG